MIEMKDTGVAVWSYEEQSFVEFFPVEGEKRIRVDGAYALSNYAVFPVTYNGDGTMTTGDCSKPLSGWTIDYT